MELLVAFYGFFGLFTGALIGVQLGERQRLAFARKVADEFDLEQQIAAEQNYWRGVDDALSHVREDRARDHFSVREYLIALRDGKTMSDDARAIFARLDAGEAVEF